MVEDKLSEEMLAGHIKSGSKVLLDSDGEQLVFKQKYYSKVLHKI